MGVDVHIIRVFEGPRHDRLRAIWEVIAEYCQEDMRLIWFQNPGAKLRHAECLDRIWEGSRPNPAERLVVTEADFLPALDHPDWLLQEDLTDPEVAFAGACYCKRTAGTRTLINFVQVPGAWFLAFDRPRCPEQFHFDRGVDPANEIHTELPEGIGCLLYPGEDPYPKHVGVEYEFGTHLFWSRHLHDDPRIRISGYRLQEIQQKHDNAVYSWIKDQPQDFQELLAKRLGSLTWESSCEYIDARSTLGTFSDSYAYLDEGDD